MGFFSRERSTEDPARELNQNQNSSNKRPGKFPNLSDFMATNEYQPKYVSGTQAYVKSGDIIYIKDTSARDTRINDRIMLVLYHNLPFAYTCLSFCNQPDFSGETLHDSHALVYTDLCQQTTLLPASAQQPGASLHRLEICLRHNHTSLPIKPDVYLNLREHWNVEQDVQLVILGSAERDSYRLLMSKIVDSFRQAITSANNIKDGKDLSASNSPESTGLKMKDSNQKGKDCATENNKGKKKKKKNGSSST